MPAVTFADATPAAVRHAHHATITATTPRIEVSPESASTLGQENQGPQQAQLEKAQARAQEKAQEQVHSEELKLLQSLYEERLRSLSTRIRETQHTIAGDELLLTMRRDPLSAQHVQARLAEIIEDSISSEQEASIGRLSRQLAAVRAELARERAVSHGSATLVAAAERQKAQAAQLQEMGQQVAREATLRQEAQAALAQAREECVLVVAGARRRRRRWRQIRGARRR